MPNTSLTFGPFLLGTFLNAILYGVCMIQSFIYYRTYTKDATWTRYFVLYLFIVETLNIGCDIGLVYEPLILDYGDPASYIFTPYMIVFDPIATVLISTPVQFFIARRIKIITGSIVIPCIIVVLGTCAFIGGIGTAVSVSIYREFSQLQDFNGAVITWLISSAITDIIITVSLSWSLMQRKTGIKSTDDKVSKIIRFTVQTGLVTVIFALISTITFVTMVNKTVDFIFCLTLPKLYTNALLSTLNSRARRDRPTGQSGNEDNVLFGSQVMSRSRGGHIMGVIEFAMDTPSKTSERGNRIGTLEDGIVVHTVVERLDESGV